MFALDIAKIGSMVLGIVISMLLCLRLPAVNAYEEIFNEDSDELLFNGNIYYQVNEFDEIMITRSRASVTEAVIPCEIDGMIVTEIKGSAFQGKTRLTKVIIPDTVTKIGDYAFYQCTRLEEIVIPSSVESVGWNILNGTPWLQNQPEGCVIVGNNIVIGYSGENEQVIIPEGTTAIAGCAFENLKCMRSVFIPESVCIIGGLAFSGCTNLTECVIPNGVRTIEAYAFNWCCALQVVTIADSVETIGNHAFFGCKSLVYINLPKNLNRIEAAVFCGCQSLAKITLPNSIKSIGNQSFMDCISLSDIILGKNIESIGEDAFKECFDLQKLTVYNGECRIADSEQTIESCTVIYGLNKSSAQIYAQKYERLFMTATPLAGDMDGNGCVDIYDATYLLYLYANRCGGIIDYVSAFDMAAGDVNGNGQIDISDSTIVLRMYAFNCAGIIE